MTTKPSPRQASPKTFCPKCKQRGIVVVKLPDGRTMCFRCIRQYDLVVYQNIVHWVIDHPPLEPKEPPAGP